MTQSVLVFAAHPDDETLGCGGTIARLASQGATVHVAFLADGVYSRPGNPDSQEEELRARRAAARKACDILGVAGLTFGDFPDNRMDSVALLDATQWVESLIEDHLPDTVLTHHCGDLNIDHRRTHQAVATACRPRLGHPVRLLLSFEVPSSTEWHLAGSAPSFQPNWFVDISETLERKLAALQAYASEMGQWPHPRSCEAVEHLARWRGASMGADAAEAFALGRKLM